MKKRLLCAWALLGGLFCCFEGVRSTVLHLEDYDLDAMVEEEVGLRNSPDKTVDCDDCYDYLAYAQTVEGQHVCNHFLGDGGPAFPTLKDCHDPSLPMPLAKKHNHCGLCKKFFDDRTFIAVLPCGDVFCRDCADLAISLRGCCPQCAHKASGYRFLTIKSILDRPFRFLPSWCDLCQSPLADGDVVAVIACAFPSSEPSVFCYACAKRALTADEQCPFGEGFVMWYRWKLAFN